jgi:hypothetical protein
MFLAYDIKNGKQYARLVKSIRKGAKDYISVACAEYAYLGSDTCQTLRFPYCT